MKNKFFLISLFVVILFIGAFWGLSKNFKNTESNLSTDQTHSTSSNNSFQITPIDSNILVKTHSPTKGSINAKVTVVEFLDPECEACSATYPFVKKIVQEFSDDVKLVVRYMPFHQNSKYAANILEGARAQGKYWEALELLFAQQDQWANHHNPNPDLIPEILAPLKINMNKILSDAKNGKYDKQILEDQADGKMSGVTRTPTFYVNGHQLQELGYEALRAAVVENLK
jgi:protein-disulfide isomerase